MARFLAIALWCTFVAVLTGATYYGFNPPDGGTPIVFGDAVWAASILGFPTAGALIATKLPKRPLGWIFLLGPLGIMTSVLMSEGPIPAGWPAADYLALGSNVTFTIGITALLVSPLFMPDGRLPGPGWRRVIAAIAVADVALILTALVEPGTFAEYPEYTNPLGVEALGSVTDVMRGLEGPISLATLTIGVVSVFLRRRNASGQERQQLKWLVLGLVLIALAVLAISLGEGLGLPMNLWAVTLLYVVAFLALPVAIGIAILRTRLYDVDVIINRALVYGALTTVLVGFYLLGILVFRRVLPLSSDSDLGVAASTLLVAALFQPARVRMQRIIDKRFYRRKYNAAATVAAFSARLRDEVELERIRDDIVGVVAETVQPVHASIWLRGTA